MEAGREACRREHAEKHAGKHAGSTQGTLTFRASSWVLKSLKVIPNSSKIFGLVNKFSVAATELLSS